MLEITDVMKDAEILEKRNTFQVKIDGEIQTFKVDKVALKDFGDGKWIPVILAHRRVDGVVVKIAEFKIGVDTVFA